MQDEQQGGRKEAQSFSTTKSNPTSKLAVAASQLTSRPPDGELELRSMELARWAAVRSQVTLRVWPQPHKISVFNFFVPDPAIIRRSDACRCTYTADRS